jgi:hypothetical protein
MPAEIEVGPVGGDSEAVDEAVHEAEQGADRDGSVKCMFRPAGVEDCVLV